MRLVWEELLLRPRGFQGDTGMGECPHCAALRSESQVASMQDASGRAGSSLQLTRHSKSPQTLLSPFRHSGPPQALENTVLWKEHGLEIKTSILSPHFCPFPRGQSSQLL